MAKTTTGNLIPSTVNTPLDARTRINTLADAANIENPILGGIFYCIETGKHYRITSLKSKTIGALTVENAAVNTYEALVDQSDRSDLSDRITAAETAIGTKAAQSDLTALSGRMTAAEGTIAEHTTAIGTKAAASDVTALGVRMTSAESAISGKAEQSDLSALSGRMTAAETAIGTKAASSDVTALAGRMTTAEGTIADHTTAIAGKAAQSDLTALAGRVTSAEETIADHTTAIAAKASASDVSALAERMTAAETAIGGNASSGDVSALDVRMTAAETAISGKASSADLTALTGRVTDAETAIGTKAASSDVTALTGRMTSAETALSGKAAASDVTALEGRVTTTEGTIADHTTAIAGKAAASDVSALAGRMTSAETALSGKAASGDVIALAGRMTAAETALSGKANQSDLTGFAPADHTHNFGAYAEVTKFEVYATNAVITAGTVDADTGLAYAEDVPASMTHYFRLRSDTPQASQDVVIDWGDGASSSLHDGDFDSVDSSEWESAGELIYNTSHTYSTPGKYIVTVNGKGYWGFQPGPITGGRTSILSRIFAPDLPMASWVKNLAGCCQDSPKLQRVMIPTGMDMFSNIHNAANAFINCTNLISATNFETKFQYTRYVSNIFKNCRNMTTCDFRMPQNTVRPSAYTGCFDGCAALTAEIADLLPERGFDGVKVTISRCFYGCASLTGTVPAALLWNDLRVLWTHADTFTGCSAAIRAQVPVSWGGTASEVEDPHPITRSQVTAVIGSKVDEAVQNLSIPASGGTGNILGGYAVKATAYDATTFTLTLDPGEEGDETDMDMFIPGTIAYVNECADDIEEDAENNIEAEWGSYKHGEIASVDAVNHTITFTEDIGMTTSNALENIYCRVADPARIDAAASLGDRNFVTGDASASADGLLNTVTGTGSHVSGSYNVVSGNFSGARGVNNEVTNNRSFASGGNNKVSGDLCFVAGNGNDIAGQGAEIFGDSNREVTGVGVKILGDGNKAAGNQVNIVGNYSEVSGNESSVLGNGLKVAAKKAVLIGQRGELADTLENQGAVAIAGGDTSDGTEEISFIHRSRKVNPLDNTETEPAFSHEYRGRLKAMTLTISTVGTIELDHDQYARWELTGTGAVTLTLANWQDGDRGEVVIDTTKQTFSIPAAWVVPDDVWDEWTETPGKYCMEIRKEGGTVYAHAAVPFNAGGSSSGGSFNVVVSSTQPASPVNGMIWIQE